MFAFRFLHAAALLLPAATLPFYILFGKSDDPATIRAKAPVLVTLILGFGLAALLMPAEVVIDRMTFDDDGLVSIPITSPGQTVVVVLLLSIVASLFLLENTWRSASVPEKTTLKYPMLGVSTGAVVMMIVLGRLLAIPVVDRTQLALQATAVLVVNASFIFAITRYRLFDVRVFVGRDVAASVVSVVIAGIYLLGLGAVSYGARKLGLPYDRLILQVAAVLAAFTLLAVLISGRVRRRIRHYVDENFYTNRYDYRKQWRRHTELTTSCTSLESFLPDFVTLLSETMMAEWGFVWVDVGTGRYASYGADAPDPGAGALRRYATANGAHSVRTFKHGAPDPSLMGAHALATLGGSGSAVGVIALGPRTLGLSYGVEDIDYLATLASEATLAVENFQLADRIVDATQMETFNRFSSYVVHDLKNTIGMLSLTAENAEGNLHDEEFQRDALQTIQRSVEKMQHLIRSLASLREEIVVSPQRMELTGRVGGIVDGLKPVAEARGASLDYDAEREVEADFDGAVLERIIENLVYNALDAVGRGGHVRVQVSARNGAATIRVSDDGPGFDRGYLENHLFRPFQTTKKEGLGIGLNMCKTLTEAHNGELSVENTPGGGALVSVRLPIVEGEDGE
jgi:signal transduction histidine kinase